MWPHFKIRLHVYLSSTSIFFFYTNEDENYTQSLKVGKDKQNVSSQQINILVFIKIFLQWNCRARTAARLLFWDYITILLGNPPNICLTCNMNYVLFYCQRNFKSSSHSSSYAWLLKKKKEGSVCICDEVPN